MTDRSISLAYLNGVCQAAALALLTLMFASTHVAAQAAAKPDVDVLTFTNGDQLTGKVVSETGGVVTFQSDMAGKADGSGGGTITVPWSRIKELHSAQKFAIITKDQKLRVGKPAPQVPVGTVSYSNDEISISGGGSEIKSIPTKDAAYMVDDASFEKAMRQETSFLQGWHGEATLGHHWSSQRRRAGRLQAPLAWCGPRPTWIGWRHATRPSSTQAQRTHR
jgi:hypothetical protein